LQSLLAARLDALEPDARRLVADAAVLGATFPAEALVAVSDQPEAQVRGLLAELVRREVLQVRADPLSPQRGHYGFVQTMFRQVAYDTLSRRERKARHLAVATHLRSSFADQGEEVAEVVAAHLIDALAAVPDDPDVPDLREQAVAMLSRAGERAVRTGAPATAAKAYGTAAKLLDDTGTPDAGLLAATLHERSGTAHSTRGDFAASAEDFRIAAESYQRHGRLRDAARAETYVGAALRRYGRLEDARSEITEALEVLKVDPDVDTVTALAELATSEAFLGNAEAADEQSAAALSEAQALDLSDAVLAELFTIRGITHTLASRPAQAAASLREAVRRAEAAHDSAANARALLNLGDSLLSTDPAAAVETTRAALVHCRRLGNRDSLGFTTANLIQAPLLTGDWTSARQVYETAVDDDELGNDRATTTSAALLYALGGEEAKLAAVLASTAEWETTEDPQDRAATATAMAAGAFVAGDFTETLRHAQRALDEADVLGLRSDPVHWAWQIAADAALASGDQAQVQRLLDRLDRERPGHIPPVLRAERQRILARMLAARNDPDAGTAFAAATQSFRQLGSPYHLAGGLLDEVEYLAARGNVRAGRQLVDEAADIAHHLGAKPLMRRAADLAAARTPEPTAILPG
jgi:tetratricopeptide (TPR) repeat protein